MPVRHPLQGLRVQHIFPFRTLRRLARLQHMVVIYLFLILILILMRINISTLRLVLLLLLQAENTLILRLATARRPQRLILHTHLHQLHRLLKQHQVHLVIIQGLDYCRGLSAPAAHMVDQVAQLILR